MFFVVEHLSGSIRVNSQLSESWEKSADGTRKSQAHVFVDTGMTIADLAKQYEVPEEAIRSANGLGKDCEIQEDTWVKVPLDRE